jgi:hypothetical protein
VENTRESSYMAHQGQLMARRQSSLIPHRLRQPTPFPPGQRLLASLGKVASSRVSSALAHN